MSRPSGLRSTYFVPLSDIATGGNASSDTYKKRDTFYQPLPHDRCTRVLRVIDSNPFSTAKMLLEMTVLDAKDFTAPGASAMKDVSYDPADFDALSYTWGSPFSTPGLKDAYSSLSDISVHITTDGLDRHLTTISRNLYDALLQIWNHGVRRYIWIDALSIDQNDAHEKARHVLLMSEIYSRASVVFVWFGVDDPDLPTFEDVAWLTDTFALMANHIRETGQPPPITLGMSIGHLNDEFDLAVTDLDLVLPAAKLRSYYRFLARRRYLARAWILQEIALSQRAIIMLGEWLLPVDRFLFVATRCWNSEVQTRYFHQFEPGQETSGREVELSSLSRLALERLTWHARSDDIERSAVDQENFLYVQGVRRLLREYFGATDTTTEYLALLEFHLHTLYRRRTSDPRDAIYSLCGYISSVVSLQQSPIQPSYVKSVREVYIETTELLLKCLPHRTVLSLVTERHQENRETSSYSARDLPSWVPDFDGARAVAETILCSSNNDRKGSKFGVPAFRAGLDHVDYPPIVVREGALIIHARCCGRVERLFRPYKDPLPNENVSQTLHRLLSTLIQFLIFCAPLRPTHPSGLTVTEALFRVVCTKSPTLDHGNGDRDYFNKQVVTLFMHSLYEALLLIGDAQQTASHPEVIALLQPNIKEMMDLILELQGCPCVPSLDDLSLFTRISTTWKQGEPIPDRDATIIRGWYEDPIIIRMTAACTVFMTDNRYVGKVFNKLEVGDELWLICDARVPFVMRPNPDGTYLLLGEALVEGAMFGEMLHNGVAGEAQAITIV